MNKVLSALLFLAAIMPGIQCPECKRPAFYFTRWMYSGEPLNGAAVVWPNDQPGVDGERIRCHWCNYSFEVWPTQRMERWFNTKTLKVTTKP